MLQLWIDSGGGDVNYTEYLIGESVNIQRSLGTPSTCTLSLVNINRMFQLPALRSYMRIYSTLTSRNLFSGFLINDAAYNYLAISAVGFPPAPTHGQMFQYDLNFTSDEYLLQLKSIAFIPAWVNQTQGDILHSLAETLCPGFFDYTFIASGQLVPYLAYDYTQSWSEYAKTFCDASNYRYSVVDKKIIFQPYGDGSLGIAYDETDPAKLFDPTQMQQSSLTTPIVNDVTVIGSQEPGNNHEDYFMGDGFTGTFALRHQVFNAGGTGGGATSGNSGTIILGDPWSETAFNANVWDIQDPANDFTLVDNALNIYTKLQLQFGESYVIANNGLELAGGIIMQHGEFTFNDSSAGIVGGVYDDTTLTEAVCETGFLIEPSARVIVTASGAAGILIQPYRLGNLLPQGFVVNTQTNHTYVLSTIVSSPAPFRYTQIYTSMGGIVFGGEQLLPNVVGTITWQVQETNIFTGFVTTYTYAASGCILPSYAIYALINNVTLNLSLTQTQIYTPPQGTLHVASEIGAGLLTAIYVSGNQQYVGAYTTPSGGNLPILPGDIGPDQQWPLGSSLQNQTAELDLGTTTSDLSFYSNDLPGVGVRIRIQTWESQAAVSRVQDPASIALEAAVVGDDGLRSAIVSNLSPLPRSSEDCDAAAQAFITDRVGNFYQGVYNASYKFFKQNTNDIEFYPTTGRYLYFNAPSRGINKQLMLVTAITTTIQELTSEAMTHSITFGPDLHLEKVLDNFVNQPANILLPADTVIIPTAIQLAQVGASYLPDIVQSNFPTLSITGTAASLYLADPLPQEGSWFELRSADLNWGSLDNYLIGRFLGNNTINITRNGFEQVWYLRFVYVDPNTGAISASRRSKVLRLYWPQVPTTPAYLYADSSTINCDFSGDIRNIEGIELRDGETDSTVYYDGIVGSEFDMMLNLDSLRGTISAGASVIGGPVGSYMKGVIPGGVTTYVNGIPLASINYPPGAGQGNFSFPGQALDQGTLLYAEATQIGSDLTSSYAPMEISGFDFKIPNGAVIDGVQINLQCGAKIGSSTISAQLGVLNSIGGLPSAGVTAIKTIPSGVWPASNTFGGAGDNWNYNWTPANINNLVLFIFGSVTGAGNLFVNEISVTVSYVAVQRSFKVHFFNLMWEYSPALSVTIPAPDAPTISEGYRWGSALQINVSSTARHDILYTTLQLATTSGAFANDNVPSGSFNIPGTQGVFYQAQTTGAVASFGVNVAVTGALWAQCQFVDHISSGAWSNMVYIPQGDLIASDYLGAQGSVPPTITNGIASSGGIIAWTSFSTSFTGAGQPVIQLASAAFGILYPNGHVDTIQAIPLATFYKDLTTNANLVFQGMYGFFPSIGNPTGPNPTMDFNGPYSAYTNTPAALLAQFKDGQVPLTNGAFVVTAATDLPFGSTGGGGGGTSGGANCAQSERLIALHNGLYIRLRDCKPGTIVKTPSGRGSKISKMEFFKQPTVRVKTGSGLVTECALGHVVRDTADGIWMSMEEVNESYESGISLWTKNSLGDTVLSVDDAGEQEICRLHLDGEEHIYQVDGIWSHNVTVKNL